MNHLLNLFINSLAFVLLIGGIAMYQEGIGYGAVAAISTATVLFFISS